MIKTIYFDTADTLYHSSDFEKAQKDQPLKQLSEVKSINLDEAKKLFKATKEKLEKTSEHVPKVAVMMELGISRIEMQEYLAQVNAYDFLSADPKLAKLLITMDKKYQLGIITNVLKKFLINIFNALQIDFSIFDHIVSVDNTSKSKPNDEPFQKAIALSGNANEECVYVGDSLTKDIIPAKRNGMKTIWVHQEQEKEDAADIRIDKIYDIESALSKL